MNPKLFTNLLEFAFNTTQTQFLLIKFVNVCLILAFITVVMRNVPVGTGVTQAGQPTVHTIIFNSYHLFATVVKRYIARVRARIAITGAKTTGRQFIKLFTRKA